MPSGGARARSGPPPDPNALRRERDQGEWVTLPAEGRRGRPPNWPLIDQTPREQELWVRLWSKPQAIEWGRLGQDLEVALYVRNLAQVEQPLSPVNQATLVRQMADSLGLTTPGLRANRWRIAKVTAEKTTRRTVTPAPSSSRSRLKVLPGGEDTA